MSPSLPDHQAQGAQVQPLAPQSRPPQQGQLPHRHPLSPGTQSMPAPPPENLAGSHQEEWQGMGEALGRKFGELTGEVAPSPTPSPFIGRSPREELG